MGSVALARKPEQHAAREARRGVSAEVGEVEPDGPEVHEQSDEPADCDNLGPELHGGSLARLLLHAFQAASSLL